MPEKYIKYNIAYTYSFSFYFTSHILYYPIWKYLSRSKFLNTISQNGMGQHVNVDTFYLVNYLKLDVIMHYATSYMYVLYGPWWMQNMNIS